MGIKLLTIYSIIIIVNTVLCLSYQNTPIVFPENGEDIPNRRPEKQSNGPSKCESGNCHFPKDCFVQFDNIDDSNVKTCILPDGSHGVCCSRNGNGNGPNTGEPIRPFLSVETRHTVQLPAISSRDINDAGNVAMTFIKNQDLLESDLKSRQLLAKSGTSEFAHQNFFGSNPRVVKLSRDGLIALQTLNALSENKRLTSVQLRGINTVDLRGSTFADHCPREPECPSTKYRSSDGSCNNLQQKSWGKSFTPFNRLLNHAYADGKDLPRSASDGSPLPSAREVSVAIAIDQNNQNRRYTLALMQFGQFLDHDLTLTASTRTNDNSALLCCGEQFRQNPRLLHPACFPIDIPSNDPFFAQFGQTCMHFVRSAPALQQQCKLGPREQMNQLTSYIDGGMIYGSSREEAASLREFNGGRLKTSRINNREFLPFSNSSDGCAIPRAARLKCFTAGDSRVNEQIELTVMQNVWLREHNRVANILSEINRGWNDEIIYQESRRIVAAELQHIVYNEFLPIIIGRRVMRANNILLTRNGYSNSYSNAVDAGITSGFATAAYRFHTLIQGVINFNSLDNRISNRIQLHTIFDNPQLLYRPGNYDSLINGLTDQPVQHGDHFFTSSVTNHLFQSANSPFGMDLVALNIQRGRDHGIPGYNAWRQSCGLSRVENFQQLEEIMSPNVAKRLSRLYRSVDDIDLFIAGVSERPAMGALVGPTFACIIGEQFRRLKNGDRFWFENGGLESSFTENQLMEIRKSSLARVLCDNSDNIKMMQPLAMVQTFQWNPKQSCRSNDIPQMDLSNWSNEPAWS